MSVSVGVFCVSYLPVRASVIRLYVKKALKTVLFLTLVGTTDSLAPKTFVFATGRGSMTPHCGVNYGSIFRMRFLCFLSARSSLCNTLLYVKKALNTVFFLTLVGTTGLPRTKDLRLCDRTGQYDTTLWCQLRKHFPFAFLCFLSARSSLCNTLICEKSTEYSAFSYFGGNNRARTCDILLVSSFFLYFIRVYIVLIDFLYTILHSAD